MKSKFLLSTLMFLLIIITLCTCSFAANNDTTDKARNAIMSTGNSIGNAVSDAAGTVANGTKNMTNGAMSIGNAALNTTENAAGTTANAIDNSMDGDYTATRTATDTGFMGMSNTTWTWLILGITGAAIFGLIWYYSSRYEHRNYNND